MQQPTRVRHIVLWLTVLAYMITYMDRVVIASAMPSIQKELGINLIVAGNIFSAFRWGYALFQIPGAWLGDRIGPRRALPLIVTWWSIFTSLTALTFSATQMLICRFLFGVGEAGAFPIATRSLSRWMLPAERGYAQGITHAGSRLGQAFTPPLVVALIAAYGWRAPFWVFGSVGLLWAGLWFYWYRDTPREHAQVNAAERDLIESNLPPKRASNAVPWAVILNNRTVWTLALMYLCYGYCIAMYQDWLPTYLNKARGFDLKAMGFFAMLPLLAGTVGDLAGGMASDFWAKRSGDLKRARSNVGVAGFLLAALSIVPATLTEDPYWCVGFTCIAMFGLEVTVGVSWAIPLDIGADYAGSVSAVMNTCGNIGGALSPLLIAYLVTNQGWKVPFGVAALFCLAGAALFTKIDATRQMFPSEKLRQEVEDVH